MQPLRIALLLSLASTAASLAEGSVLIEFSHASPLTSGNLGSPTVSISIGSDGSVTGSFTSAAPSISDQWTISGNVADGFTTDFDLTISGTQPINTRSQGGSIGVGGINAGRIDGLNEIMTVAVDATGLPGFDLKLVSIGYGNTNSSGSDDPDMVFNDYDGSSVTFENLVSGGLSNPVSIPSGNGLLAGGTIDQFTLTQGQVPLSGNVGYGVASLEFDILTRDLPGVVIDRASGTATLSNPGASPFEMVGLSLRSDAGSLDPSDWNSIAQTYDAGGSNGGNGTVDADDQWFILEDSVTELAEATLGATVLAHDQSVDLGQVFRLGAPEDILAEFADPNTQSTLPLNVSFINSTPAGLLAGDYNEDGVVDAADYTLWRDSNGQANALPNETVSLGRTTTADYTTWRANFGASSVNLVTVPEPMSIVLVALGALAIGRLMRNGAQTRPA